MSGTISLALTQQLDSNGRPLAGGKLYFFQSGTTTPQAAFQDTDLTLAHPNPITLDAAGRIPNFYLADGRIKVRLDDDSGVTILAVDNLLVIGPTSPAAAVGTIDSTALPTTGALESRYDTGTRAGWVRLNGRTIGAPFSGATELASSDAEDLYVHLWTVDPTLSVSTGRGAAALDDYNANKTLTLPDARGRALWGLDNMGAASAGRMNTLSSTTLGGAGGLQTQSITLNIAQLPTFTPTGNIGAITPTGNITYAGQFTPVGVISYSGLFTPAGVIGAVTPTGTISRPAVNITDPGHPHTLSPAVFATGSNQLVNVAGAGSTYGSIGPATLSVTQSNTTGITAALAADPVFTGNAFTATFTGTAGALPGSIFTGTPGTLPGATFTGNPVTPVFTGNPIGSGAAISISSAPPAIFVTIYIKL